MNYQIAREPAKYSDSGVSLRMIGEFYPYEVLGSKYIGFISPAEYLAPDMFHYVAVIGETQLPGVCLHKDDLDEYLQYIARMNDEQSERDNNNATEAREWAHIIQTHAWTVRTANEDRTTEYSSLNDD